MSRLPKGIVEPELLDKIFDSSIGHILIAETKLSVRQDAFSTIFGMAVVTVVVGIGISTGNVFLTMVGGYFFANTLRAWRQFRIGSKVLKYHKERGK